MARSYLDDNGLLYFWQKIQAVFAPKASPAFTGTPTAPTATAGTSSSQLATTEFVANAVSSSAGEANQNAFAFIGIESGSATILEATSEQDTVTFIAGNNVTMTASPGNNVVTLNANVTSITNAEIDTIVAT